MATINKAVVPYEIFIRVNPDDGKVYAHYCGIEITKVDGVVIAKQDQPATALHSEIPGAYGETITSIIGEISAQLVSENAYVSAQIEDEIRQKDELTTARDGLITEKSQLNFALEALRQENDTLKALLKQAGIDAAAAEAAAGVAFEASADSKDPVAKE